MNIFASSLASANAWMMQDRHLPIWSMSPAEAVFLVVSFTEAQTPPFARRIWNNRSRIEQNAFDLWGIVAIGDILSSFGELALMLAHSTNHAWFVCIFSSASAAKCNIASGESAERCGPCSIASWNSAIDHGFPVFVGHPNVAQSLRRLAAGWPSARPLGHMEFLCGKQEA
jgi:hypothetical protein